MARVELVIDARGAVQALDRLIALADNPGVMLSEIGEHLLESTQLRINVEKASPDGVPWAPVSPEYAKAKAAGRATSHPGDQRSTDPKDLLRLTHRLVENIFYQVESGSLVIGSSEIYAGVQQDARPYLGVSPADATEIEQIAIGALSHSVTGS